MTWWLWITVGLVLAAIELTTPGGFFIIFFGVGALAVGALDLAGLAQPPWAQWLLFPIISLVALRLFRKPLLGRMRIRDGAAEVDSMIGEIAIASDAIGPGDHGRAELRGTTWSAHNIGAAPLSSGQRCRVIAVQGLMLDIRPE